MLEHGGRLHRAARQYGIEVGDWLDLSTGISPFAWPVATIPARAWHRLPEEDDGLDAVAHAYYGSDQLLPVAGTQAALQALPWLRAPSRVGVITPGYAEHAHAWRAAGHAVETLPADELFAQAGRFDVVVLIHPNNPGSETFRREALLALHAALAARGGWLVIDEAFIDATPDASVVASSARAGLVVLRSVGKFFGLAGARAGFVAAAAPLREALRERLGPWTLTGPTRHVLAQALSDRVWHETARARLRQASALLAEQLDRHGLDDGAGTALFQWRRTPHAPALHDALARRGVLVRLFDAPASLRFGLPADEGARARLEAALSESMADIRGQAACA